MQKTIVLLAAVIVSSTVSAQKKPALFEAQDLTQENTFSQNIEGPNFDKAGNLYVVNFQKDGTIGKINTKDGSGEVFVTLADSSTANSIVFNSEGNMYLADFKGHNILEVNMKTKAVSVYVHSSQFNQPNDICITSKGKLFATDPNWRAGSGQLWRIDKGGNPVLLERRLGTANGIALGPDEKNLYINESVQRKIWRYDVDDAGNIFNKKLFAEFPDFGFDGMKCDKAGNLYVCRHGKGVIAVLSPDGKLIREVPLKGKLCSNLVFGGKDKKTVYVTLQDRKCIETFRVDIAGK